MSDKCSSGGIIWLWSSSLTHITTKQKADANLHTSPGRGSGNVTVLVSTPVLVPVPPNDSTHHADTNRYTHTSTKCITYACVHSLPRWHSGICHLLQCPWPVWRSGSGGLGSTPGSGGLSVHAGQLSAYSEINISAKHRGFNGVLFNLWPLANTGFRDTQY